MKVFFGGAEAPTLRARLLDNGVERVTFNYSALYDRTRTPSLDAMVNNETDIILYSGASSANANPDKRDAAGWGKYLDDYITTVQDNIERIELATEFAFVGLGLDGIHQMREDFWQTLPSDAWAPIWMPGESLEDLAEEYARVTIPAVALKQSDEESFARDLKRMSHKHGVRFHLMGAVKDVWVKVAQADSISTSAWTASTRYGETILWDGHKLRRIPAEQKTEKRRRHKALIEALGCDPKKVLADDPDEVSRLAIMSIMAWEEKHGGNTVAGTTPRTAPENKPDSTALTPVTKGVTERHVKMPEGRKMLPVLGLVQREDETGVRDPEMRTSGANLRRCDDCPVSSYCPEYAPGNECAYDIPVVIRTKDQLLAAMSTMVEMQAQRAMFARFMEELEGGAPNKSTSAEMERFFAMAEKMKNISQDGNFMRVTIEGHANAGVISRLFGDRAGETQRELPAPVDGDEVLAEVLDES